MVANLVSGCIPFALLLFLTRYFSPDDFGIIGLYTALTTVASAIISLGVNGAISRYYFDLSKEKFSIFVGSCLYLVGMAGFIFGGLTYSLRELIFFTIHFPVKWIWIVLLTAISQVLILIGLAIFQVQNQVRLFAITQIAQAAIVGLLSVIFVAGLSWGWEGRILAQAISTAVFSAAVLYYLYKTHNVCFRLNRKYCLEALDYGLPLVIHSMGGIAISLSDRFILARISTLDNIGLYVIACQIVSIFIFAIDAFNRAYSPWLFSNLSAGKSDIYKRIIRGTYLYFLSILILAIIFSLLSEWLIGAAFSKKYSGSIEFLAPLSIAAAFMGMYYMVTLYLQFAKRTKQLASITLLVGGINILLSIELVGRFGAIGAAYALAFSQACLFLASWAASAYFFPMPWLSIFNKK